MSTISTTGACVKRSADLSLSAQGALVDFLTAWRSSKPTFFERILDLSHAMADAKFWDRYDADAIALWLGDLTASGYQQPQLVDWTARAALDAPNGWQKTDAAELETVFTFAPKQETSIYLTDTLHNHTLAPDDPASLEGCVYADVEVKMSSIWSARHLLSTFLESYKLNMYVTALRWID